MGTACGVVVVGGSPELAVRARARIEELESRWSRFRPHSEVSRINNADGRWIGLTTDTFMLMLRAIDAWRATGGRFDPTVLRALEANGYDRTFEHVSPEGPRATAAEAPPGGDVIELDPRLRAIRVPPGVGLDFGGLGKGLAADLVVAMLRELGAAGACVSLGGDVRVTGEPPDDEGWRVGLADPYHEGHIVAAVRVDDGAVTTSTRLQRRWRRGGRDLHHLIDPATGQPADGGLDAVTVIAAEGWWAEAQTKAAFVAGRDQAIGVLTPFRSAGLLFGSPDDVVSFGPIDVFLVPTTV